MLFLGIDIGTSSIKVSVVDGKTQKCIASAQYPDIETPIYTPQPGWAEQSPNDWWLHVQQAILRAHESKAYNPKDIGAIGIAYQMHGLVLLDEKNEVLRNSIIWCDSRAIPYGDKAFKSIGEQACLSSLLNSPGNFTAAKLAWVKEIEPEIFERIAKIMLPGDFIAQRLTGEITTTPSALSEGIFWDFMKDKISGKLLDYYGFPASIIPEVKQVFAEHGILKQDIASSLLLNAGIPVSYKAGDQPNNALALNVFKPGEVAATAGTSGVIYGVSDELSYDEQSRVNGFAHVNHHTDNKRIGTLLCINGTGILNRWIKDTAGSNASYKQLNEESAKIPAGSSGVRILPFGNGAERILNNKIIGAHFHNIDFNKHTRGHMYRAGQEGIAFAFRYGLDIMRENGHLPTIIRAGKTNMFLSEVFTEAFVNATGVPVELYESDGSVGAAIGAGIGCGYFKEPAEAFQTMKPLQLIEPTKTELYNSLYQEWKELLIKQLG